MRLDPLRTLRCIKIEWMVIGFGFAIMLVILGFCVWRTWIMDGVIIKREGLVNRVIENQEKMLDRQQEMLVILRERR